MSRRRDRMVERLDPVMGATVRAAVGDQAAALAVEDRDQELIDTSRMMIDLIEVGKSYWITTQTFPIIGVVVAKGIDYVMMNKAALVMSDGRTSTLMKEGRATNMEVEPIGDRVRVAADQFGFFREWPFPLITEPDTPTPDVDLTENWPEEHPGRMLVDTIEVGKPYWITTQTFPIIGVVRAKGLDYVAFDKSALIMSDGRTSTLMRQGTAPHMEIEPIGTDTWVGVAVDQFGFVRDWPFPLITEPV